jgi:hypothetical protein
MLPITPPAENYYKHCGKYFIPETLFICDNCGNKAKVNLIPNKEKVYFTKCVKCKK